jgi:uncharacterized coiled-coil DUF342 family protein
MTDSEVKRMQCGITCVPECCRREGKDCNVPTDKDLVLASDFDRVQRERDLAREESNFHQRTSVQLGEVNVERAREIAELRAEVAKVKRDPFSGLKGLCDSDKLNEVCDKFKALRDERNEALEEVARVADVRDSWCAEYVKARDERDALRALIEAHNARVPKQNPEWRIPLPGGDG